MPVAAVLHINKVKNNDAAQIADADLTCDLIDGFEVCLCDSVLETRISFTDKFAGIDVDRDECLGLIYDEIAAAL